MVGAVIVRDGEVLGEGWHRRFGGPHAEVEAIAKAARRGHDVRGATMYVSLEPCCHHGKTPPCTEAIVAAGIRRVVVAMSDPDDKVAGRGIAQLRRAGVEVTVGICRDAARQLLGPYIKTRTRRRPWVICKWAQTPDGLVALPAGSGRWVSCAASRRRVHELRGTCQGICVGIGTVLADDPLLTNRGGRGGQPARVVLDCSLRIPMECKLVRSAASVPLIIATTKQGVRRNRRIASRLRESGAELLELPARRGRIDLGALLDELGRRGWTYLLVEGGPTVLDSFIRGGLADELLVFVSGRGVENAPQGLPRYDIAVLDRRLDLPEPQTSRVGDDNLLRFVLSRF